jgi:hypothetical protein
MRPNWAAPSGRAFPSDTSAKAGWTTPVDVKVIPSIAAKQFRRISLLCKMLGCWFVVGFFAANPLASTTKKIHKMEIRKSLMLVVANGIGFFKVSL